MTIMVCSRCSGQVIALDGHVPEGCPKCGATLDISAEVTNALDQTGAATETPEPPRLRAKIGRYAIVSMLGSGGCSTVYLARDAKLDRLVAIKVPDAVARHDPAAAERFAREGRTAAQLRHPGIVSIFNVEEEEGLVFIVSEYVEGEPLNSQLKKSRPSFRAVASLLAAVASAVEYAHSKGIIHRDIKPGNIMIDAAGNPRLMDFGLAKQVERDATVTMQKHVLGTPVYMSPEQARGNSQEVDRRTDVYSLGATLYHLLTHQIPFYGEAGMVCDKVLHEQPTRPRMIDRLIPIDLETICLKAMEKEPSQRYQTARELADDLERWLRGEPIVARNIGPLERSWRWCRRNPAPAGMIVSVALLLVVASIGSMIIASLAAKGREQEAERRRQAEAAKKVEAAARARSDELLSRQYVERGSRYLRAPVFSDDYNPIKALPWFYEAMKVDTNPHRLLADRIRLQMQLDFTPWIERMWFAKGKVRDARIAPKGETFFVLTEDDRTLRIWRTAVVSPPLISLSVPSHIDAAAFSYDGRLIATGSQDGVRIWEADSGKLIKGPLASGSRALNTRSLIFSASGRLLSILSLEGVNQIWDVNTGKPLGTPPHLYDGMVGFADSERLIVLVGRDQGLHAHDVQTGSEKYVVGGTKDGYAAGGVSPNGDLVAGRGRSGKLVVFPAVTGKPVKQFAGPVSSRYVACSAFSPDGRLLAAGSVDGIVRIWNVDEGRLLWAPRQVLSHSVDQLEFSSDGASLAVTNLEKNVRIVATRTGDSIAPPIGSSTPMALVGWIDLPGRIVIVDRDGVIRLWNVEHGVSACMLPFRNEIDVAKISTNRRVLAAAQSTGVIHLFKVTADSRVDVQGGKAVNLGERHIDDIALSNDGSYLAVSTERQVSIWSTKDQKQIAGPLRHSKLIKHVRFTPNGAWLISLSEGGRAAVWEVATGRPLYEPLDVGANTTDLDVDRDGKRCAVATLQRITIWELASGQRVGLRIDGGSFNCVRFLNDRNRALIAKFQGPLQLFDIDSGRPLPSLNNSLNVKCLALSDDRRVFLTGSQDGTVRLWNSENGFSASPLFDYPSPVQDAFLDSTGDWAATRTDDSHFVLWDARTAELLSSVAIPSLWPALSDRARLGYRLVRLVSFSSDNRSLYLITSGGLLVRLKLDVDHRTSSDINAEIALRSGVVPDGSGGLRILGPDELATLWPSNARKLADSPSASSRFEPLDFGQEAKAALSTTQVPVR